MDRTVEEDTHRDLEINSQNNADTKTSSFIDQKKNPDSSNQKSKMKPVFQKSSTFWIGCKYSLLALPFLLFSCIFGGIEIDQAKRLTSAVKLQAQLQTMQQNIHLVLLYGMQHGTEDNKYPLLLNFPTFLSGLMNQIY